MHFEILIEDQSGKRALDILVPKIIDSEDTFRVISYRGIGRIPRNLANSVDPNKRILLSQLPKLLRGYGKTFAGYGVEYKAAVIVVCDLDNRCLQIFRNELLALLCACDPRPATRFCFAIEECEAWFLGDLPAVQMAYPKAKNHVLESYENDSICGTWERLADAVFAGGARALEKSGWQTIGAEKSVWSETITPHMDIENNKSPSFCYFRDKMRSQT